MRFLIKTTLYSILFSLFLGCNSKKEYDNASDRILLDLDAEIAMLESESTKIEEDLVKVKKGMTDPDFDFELQSSLKTELFQGEFWTQKLFDHIAYRKIKKRQRLELLNTRKQKGVDYSAKANKECDNYFQNKALHPLKKGWENRYRAAADI